MIGPKNFMNQIYIAETAETQLTYRIEVEHILIQVLPQNSNLFPMDRIYP